SSLTCAEPRNATPAVAAPAIKARISRLVTCGKLRRLKCRSADAVTDAGARQARHPCRGDLQARSARPPERREQASDERRRVEAVPAVKRHPSRAAPKPRPLLPLRRRRAAFRPSAPP